MDTYKGLTINLVKKKGTPSLDVFIQWAITGGRFLVILTETIALGAFLYRFTLDRQIVDLHDSITQKQRIVAAFAPDEQLYRNLQERLDQTQSITTGITVVPELFNSVQQLATKNRVSLILLTINDKNFHVEFTSNSLTNLKSFINDLSKVKGVNDVSIDRIEDRVSTAELAAEISCTLGNTQPVIKNLGPVPSIGTGGLE